MITRFRGWFRRCRRIRASKRQKAELREFVYLDEVSVYSLIASRLGPIAKEFTETETASLQREIAGSFGADAGIAKAELSPRRLTTQTQGSQVLRRSIVQTTFKELYELEMDSLAMQPMSEDAKPPKIRNLNDLETETKTSVHNGWIVDPEDLARGQLLEVEVQLEAEPIFRVSAVISAVLDIVEETPEVFGLGSHDGLVQARAVNRILEKLLVGLVPVRGHAADYRVVKIGEKEWIVHRRILDELEITDPSSMCPLFVVGVAEQSLFWKDIRRVLFSKARFRVLCRMGQDGVQDSWTPVKLAHVLESVAPDLAREIDTIGSSAFDSMALTNTSNQSVDPKQRLMRDALVSYATLLAAHYGYSLAAQDSSEVGLLAEQYCTFFGSQKERREAFDAIATLLLARSGVEREPSLVALYRAVALADAGLCFSGQVMPLVTSDALSPVASCEERFLDSEFIAMYW